MCDTHWVTGLVFVVVRAGDSACRVTTLGNGVAVTSLQITLWTRILSFTFPLTTEPFKKRAVEKHFQMLSRSCCCFWLTPFKLEALSVNPEFFCSDALLDERSSSGPQLGLNQHLNDYSPSFSVEASKPEGLPGFLSLWWRVWASSCLLEALFSPPRTK